MDREALKTRLESTFRVIPNFPKPGVSFKDITPLFQEPSLFKEVITFFSESISDIKPNTAVACIEARGFFFGTALAISLGLPLVAIRKKGKVPYQPVQMPYTKEYGSDTLEASEADLEAFDNFILIEDLIGTGGTVLAALKLLTSFGASVSDVQALTDLSFLEGTKKILDEYPDVKLTSLFTFS